MTGPFVVEAFRIAHGMAHGQRVRPLAATLRAFIETLAAELP
jgi:hypothetical protein